VYIKDIKIQGGGKGLYSNTGSCIGVTNYLQHEELDKLKDGQVPEPFFTYNKDQIGVSEVTYKIDHNKAQLHKTDSKFSVLKPVLDIGPTRGKGIGR